MHNNHSCKPVNLPNLQKNKPNISYTLKAIDRSLKGYHFKKGSLMIDQGFGDHNMSLFRRKDRLNYIRQIPSAFTPYMRDIMHQRNNTDKQRRIITQHNQRIQNILRAPKEVYIQNMLKQKKQKQKLQQKANQYIKGKYSLLKEESEHLGFRYVTEHQADSWFEVQDNSHLYHVPPRQQIFQEKVEIVVKKRKKKGFIFASDNPKINYFFKQHKQ